MKCLVNGAAPLSFQKFEEAYLLGGEDAMLPMETNGSLLQMLVIDAREKRVFYGGLVQEIAVLMRKMVEGIGRLEERVDAVEVATLQTALQVEFAISRWG